MIQPVVGLIQMFEWWFVCIFSGGNSRLSVVLVMQCSVVLFTWIFLYNSFELVYFIKVVFMLGWLGKTWFCIRFFVLFLFLLLPLLPLQESVNMQGSLFFVVRKIKQEH